MFTGLGDLKGSAMPPSPSSQFDGGAVISPGSIDRVFPIRSAVSIDPSATPMTRYEYSDGYPGMSLAGEGIPTSRRVNTETTSVGASGSNSSQVDDGDSPSGSPRTRPKAHSFSRGVVDDQTPTQNLLRRASVMSDQTSNKFDKNALGSMLSDVESVKSMKSQKSEAASSLSGGVSLASRGPPSKTNEELPLVTARFKHVVTDGGHAVITGRDGDTLQRCEDEPIHIPGAVQSFGLLISFKEEAGKLIVHVVSENSAMIIGYTPQQLFKLDNFLDIFTEEQADNLLDHLDFLRDEDAADVVANGPEVFMLSIRPPHHRTRKLWCAMHLCAMDKETVIAEFEIEDDPHNPLVPNDDMTPEPPEDTLGSDPTPEELAESTINISRPLRVLRSARKKRGEAAAMEVFNIMSQVQEQLASAPSLPVFLKVLIGVVKELTGFHRVMVYQFDQQWNGRVVAELVDPRATKDLYKGLNFPASDIPKQARDLYKLNKVRLLYDREQETSRLVCRTPEDLERPLDLTHAYLRAMSPIHVKYLRNMAVRSSMSISINAFNELWGLIACHTYGSKGMRVSFPIRKMCRLVGDTASRNIERLSYASRLQARKLINTTSSAQNPSGYIVASSEDLLQLFDADVGALSIREETKIMGNPAGHLQEVLAMIEFLRLKRMNTVFTSHDISMDFPDLRYGPGLKFLAGVLFVPLSTGGNDFIAFFRKGVLQEVKWAGNPYEKFIKEGTEGYLEPRKSFKQWSETIVGRCKDWSEDEIETASVLCLVYGKFIDVWRQKEAALQNSQLTRLLLANSAHEVRTPLNAIINYLEIALEGSLDQETRDNLAKSHSASKSLVYVINDLLDLTKTEENQNLVKEEVFNLHDTLREATDPFIGDAKRKNITYTVDIDDTIPQEVLGDHRRVRQIVSNLISNAVQHTAEGGVTVEAWRVVEQSNLEKCEIEISVEDTGSGMSQSKVDALFQELEEVTYQSDVNAQKLLEQSPFASSKDNDVRATLGLGLAVVARTIRNMNGQLRLRTEEGKGSRFIIILGFEMPKSTRAVVQEKNQPNGVPSGSPHKPTLARNTSGQDGEVTLVKRSSSLSKRSSQEPVPIGLIGRKESADSINSLSSMKSARSGASGQSARSDADRLIDAIQEPLRLSDLAASPTENTGAKNKIVRSHSAGDKAANSQTTPRKTKSVGSTKDLRSALAKVPGQESVTDSGTPLRPVRVPEFQRPEREKGKGVTFNEDLPPLGERVSEVDENSFEAFSVLVAEDDPINSRIMKKRLEKLGHKAHMTVNGEECSSAHGEQSKSFDAVLMDLQMPIVDGFGSTKMIRSFEKTQMGTCLSTRAKKNGRLPIFAVSASLIEKERDKYIATGFDGWILKPVDFKRVNQLLRGIVDESIRAECIYAPGKWELGGWFEAKNVDRGGQEDVDTKPSGEPPTVEAERNISICDAKATEDSVTSSENQHEDVSAVNDTA